MLERFVVIMYCRTSDDVHVSPVSMTLFSRMSRNNENIPPTVAAVDEHVKRAVHQAAHIWDQSLQLQPLVPNPTDWGWERTNDIYQPGWTTLLVAEQACYCMQMLKVMPG